MNPNFVFARRLGAMPVRILDLRAISPTLVEFSLNHHWDTARWCRGRYESGGQDKDRYILCNGNHQPAAMIPEWRPPEQRMGRWAVTEKTGVRWLDKSRPPIGNCELTAKSASGRHAATITVSGNRTIYIVDRGEGVPPLTGERLLAPHLLSVVAEIEEEWDRWWWTQEYYARQVEE